MPDSTDPEQWQMALKLRPSPTVAAMPSLKGTDSLTGNIILTVEQKNLHVPFMRIKFNLTSRLFIS